MTDPFMIFVDGTPVEATAGDTTIESIERWRPELALELRAGTRALTDSRGLPSPIDSAAYAGAIFRVVSARPARTSDTPNAPDTHDTPDAKDGD
ncbi:MAG: hypothetical protein ACR2M1_00855 [Gemmatimonadaceae bacterium]